MTMALTQLTDCVTKELDAVRVRFDQELVSDLSCVNSLVNHVARFRGKMLRPTLLLLAGRAGGELTDAHITLGTVVEMVHMATLVHDDVLDEAELRRKGATINHLRGNEAAVILGDYLISHSYHLCASLDSQFASRLIAATTNRVCEGELLQLQNRNNFELDEETYFDIIDRKTAALCAACCALGGRFAGATQNQVDALELFGRNLGIAFQIQDDVLDIIGDAHTVGKTLGIDVEKGKMTLPMIHFMNTAPAAHRKLLRSLLEGREVDRGEKIRNLLLPGHSMRYAHGRAVRLIEEAIDALNVLPDSVARQGLIELARFTIARPM